MRGHQRSSVCMHLDAMAHEMAEDHAVLDHPRVHAVRRARILRRDALREARPELHDVPCIELVAVVLVDVQQLVRSVRAGDERGELRT